METTALVAIGTLLNGLYIVSGLAVAIVFLVMLYTPKYNEYLVEFYAEAKDHYQGKSMAEVLFFGPYAILGYLWMAVPWLMGASPLPGILLAIAYTFVSGLIYVRYLRTYAK